ncbi:transcriptional repressor general negative regulator of transcription subunit 4 [Rhizina undulata]
MSRMQQDSFIDDTEEFCPLCVEEFDIQDRNFKPCPCGYQICQFCFNNIRSNLNGLCPACRRPYDDKTIEYKAISAEEMRAEQNKKNRKESERRKHEAQKREIELLNRKHLAGLRVVQKNLVYVTGLNPRIREEDLLQTLRGEQYFGQYGKIIKIVVNKRTTAQDGGGYNGNQSGHGAQGLGVYVTFARKQDAASCIAAVDGSQNGDRVLRATYGTTKYCSAYLRNESCPNKNCMFLHEPGEEADSFSRLDLSSINSRQTQPQGSTVLPPPPPPPVTAPPLSQQIHLPPNQQSSQMARVNSHTGGSSNHDGESSALPSTANWAKNPPTPATRPAIPAVQQQPPVQVPPPALSKMSTPSPKTVPAAPMVQTRSQESGKSVSNGGKVSVSTSTISNVPNTNGKLLAIDGAPIQATPEPPAPTVAPEPPAPAPAPKTTSAPAPAPAPTTAPTPAPVKQAPPPPPLRPSQPDIPAMIIDHINRLNRLQDAAANPGFKFVFSAKILSPEEYRDLENTPPMFDRNGGKRRRELAEKAKKAIKDSPGKIAPEAYADARFASVSRQVRPGQDMASALPGRGTTPLERDPLIMLKEAAAASQQEQQQIIGAFQQETLQQQQQQQQPPASMRIHTPANILQQQSQQSFNAFPAMPGMVPQQQQQQVNSLHGRQSSRYTFANDNPASSSTTSVNARGNAVHMAEQVRMMPQQGQQQQMQHQQLVAQFYGAGGAPGLGGGMLSGSIQQPPPGLKSAPTPPAPGMGGIPMGGMPSLGQFSALGLGGHHGKSSDHEAMLKEILMQPGNNSTGNKGASFSRGGDGKIDLGDPSILHARPAQPQQPIQIQHHQGIQASAQNQQGPPSQIHTPQIPFRMLTPGIVDEDFPALAPAPTPVLSSAKPAIAIPAIGSTKKASIKGKFKATAATKRTDTPDIDKSGDNEKDKEDEDEKKAQSVDENINIAEKENVEDSDEVKHKEKQDLGESLDKDKYKDAAPVLIKPTTKSAAKQGSKQKPSLPPVDTTVASLAPAAEKTTPAFSTKMETTPNSPAVSITATQRQGPRMMRILSANSNISVASSSKYKGPSTPAAESAFSDTASGTSSRPVSPPPSVPSVPKYGPQTAGIPVNVKSKNAIKKERIAAMKEKERKELEELEKQKKEAGLTEEVQAPIVGRMKKKEKKKEKPTRSSVEQTGESSTAKGSQATVEEKETEQTVEKEVVREREPVKNKKKDKAKEVVHEPAALIVEKNNAQTPASAAVPKALEKPGEKSNITAAQILQELQGEINFSELEMFKPVMGLKWEHHITPEDIQKIRAQKSGEILKSQPGSSGSTVQLNLRGGGTLNTRMFVTPGGSILRGLTVDQEQRYLRMEERRRDERSYERWGGGNPSIDQDDDDDEDQTKEKLDKEKGWKSVVMESAVAAGITAAAQASGRFHGAMREGALDYLWNTLIPALPAAAQEHLQGLAQNVSLSNCKVNVEFENDGGIHGDGEGITQTMTVDVAIDAEKDGIMETLAEFSVEELEKKVWSSRKKTEAYEKKLEKLVKRNKKLVGLI